MTGNPVAPQIAAGGHRLAAHVRTVATILLFAAAFFVVQRLTFTLRFPPFERTTIWTPGALLLAALLLESPRAWWRYYVGLCVGVTAAYAGDAAIPAPSALFAAHFLFIAAALGAWWIRRHRAPHEFGTTAAVVRFVAVAGVFVPLAVAAPTVLSDWLRLSEHVWPTALRSYLCIALGMLIATPALTLTIRNGPAAFAHAGWSRRVEAAALVVTLAAAGHLAFGQPIDQTPTGMLYLPVPMLVWAALRFGLAGVSVALLIVAFHSTWWAIRGRGPFTDDVFADNVLGLQIFILSQAIPLMFLAVVIEQRSRATRALAQSEADARAQFAHLSTVYRGAPIGLAFIDPTLRLIDFNDRFVETTGLAPGRHRDRSLREALPELADLLEPACRRVLETGEPVTDLEMHPSAVTGADAERVWRSSHHAVRDAEGTILGVSSMLEEVTDRKRAERLRHELIRASRIALLGEFGASLAHELNQPLGAVVGNAGAATMLLDRPHPPLDEIRRILDDIERDMLRASEIVRGVRMMASRRTLERQTLDLNALVSETAALIAGEATRRGVSVRLALDDSRPVVHADRIQIQQLVMNLLSNGLDAMDGHDGRRDLAVTTQAGDGGVEVIVADSGPGLAPERLSQVFEHYFSTKEDGVGLGLAIARTIAELHGGTIHAENAPDGRGAIFRFRLPIGDGVVARGASEPAESVPLTHGDLAADRPSGG